MGFITKLSLANFRCYEGARIEDVPGGLIVLHGANGAGKTNVLEAISLLTPGRGLRNASLEDMQRKPPHPILGVASDHPLPMGEGGAPRSGEGEGRAWSIAAQVFDGVAENAIGTGLDADSYKRAVRINGVNAKSQMALADYLSALWLTPQMDRLFIDGASTRRRFFDKLVFTFDPAHAGRVTRYENAMSQRSKLLREGKGDDHWLHALETQMAETGIAIAAARLDFMQRLQAGIDAGDAEEDLFFPRAKIGLSGTLEELLGNTPALEVENMLLYQLRQSRTRDAETGGAASGPHKTDLLVRFAAKNMPADQCSTGEQKALLIGLILSHARLIKSEKGDVPLLLLDEIAAHLDDKRRAALFERLTHLGGQVWMTGTDESLFSAIEKTAAFHHVQNAEIINKKQ
jgi:DNA replication and repair protein RecF